MTQQKDTLINWKSAFGLIVGLFVAGAIATVAVTTYLDDRAGERFYAKDDGKVLEQRVKGYEDKVPDLNAKIEAIQVQQNTIIFQLGEIKGRLDHIK